MCAIHTRSKSEHVMLLNANISVIIKLRAQKTYNYLQKTPLTQKFTPHNYDLSINN